MNMSSRKFAVSLRSGVFGLLLVAFVALTLSLAPTIYRTHAQNGQKLSDSSTSTVTKRDPKIVYPESKKIEHVDEYFGVKVPDPYRWLEDETSVETKAWVESQNKVTFGYLEKIPYREKLKTRLTQLFNYPRIGAPFRRGDTYFFAKNDGLQNQSVYYTQKGLNGTPEEFLDPNKFSADGTSTLSAFSLSKDGKYLAYGMSTGGSDWVEIHVMEVATRKVLPDHLKWLKASGVSWQGDGFYYSRYPQPEKGRELSFKK